MTILNISSEYMYFTLRFYYSTGYCPALKHLLLCNCHVLSRVNDITDPRSLSRTPRSMWRTPIWIQWKRTFSITSTWGPRPTTYLRCLETSRFVEVAQTKYLKYLISKSYSQRQLSFISPPLQFVCVGGSANRMKSFAQFIHQELALPGNMDNVTDICEGTDRYSMYKVGPVLSISVSIAQWIHLLHKIMVWLDFRY